MLKILFVILFVIIAPLLGGLLAGIDRKISARCRASWAIVFQPFYDVFKLLEKETMVVRRSQNFYVYFSLIMIIFTTSLFAWEQIFFLSFCTYAFQHLFCSWRF
jgi:formate hydrogenlyase subunit 4